MAAARNVVVIGAGLGGLRAVESLRREGFDGRITLVGEEEEPPYDRPPLSKEVLTGARSPRTLDDLDGRGGVHTLRTLGDSLGLRAALLEARHVTVIGAGFIGSEVAA